MKQLILILALLPLAGFGQTKNVLKGISTNALTEPLVVPTGKSITIDSGATITNNGTATGFGDGSVTSVALTMPSIFSVSGSPITTSGTLAASLATQAANLIFAGPTTGSAAAPTFRSLVAADIPDLSGTYQPLSATLTTLSNATAAGLALMDDADAAAQRATLGLGAAALLEVSTGGNAGTDQDKLARYQSAGQLAATANMIVYDDDFPLGANKAAYYAHNSVSLPNGGGLYATIQASGNSATLTITLPPVSGTLIGTGNLTSITALGTVTTGTWQADDIALAYLAQGGATDGQAMVWDNTAGTWEPGTISSGLTVGSTSVASGTDGYVLYNNAGTLGQLASTGTGNVVRAASPTITGTLTAGTIYGKGNDQLGDGIFYVNAINPNPGSNTGVQIWNNWSLHWRTTNSVALWGDVADQLWLRNTTRAQGVVIANTWSSTTSYETVDIGWSGSVAHLWTTKGSGGGTARDLVLGFDSTEKLRINASGVTIGSGGSAISKVLTATATLNFDLTALVVEDLTVTCTGAAVGDSVFIGVPHGSVTTSAQFTAWVSAADTVTVRCRTSVVGEDPASGTFRVDVHQH